jgi:hypothetical protein
MIVDPKEQGTVYMAAFHFSWGHATGEGYGDIHPTNYDERFVSIIIQAAGALISSVIIGSIVDIVTLVDPNTKLVQEEQDAISSWCRISNMPHRLGKRVRRYFRHYYSSRPAIDQGAILKQLSKNLRSEVAEFLLSTLMQNIDIFTCLGDGENNDSTELWAAILPRLRPVKYEDGEALCEQGDVSSDLFIIIDGKVKCQTKLEKDEMNHLAKYHGQDVPSNGKIARLLSAGDALNDLNLLGIWEYCVEGAKAMIPTDAYVLTNEDIKDVFEVLKDADMLEEMRYYAKSRYDTIMSETNSWGRPLRVRSNARIDA